jgi:hypothetical protein
MLVGERRFNMPDALELPWMLLSIVELMSGEAFPALRGSVVNKLITLAFGHPSRAGLFAPAACLVVSKSCRRHRSAE